MSPRTGRPLETQCNSTCLDVPMLGRREIVADFDGGYITSDGGALLLRKAEQLTSVIGLFAACFTDHRNPDLIEHTLGELVAQRVYALALGYYCSVSYRRLYCSLDLRPSVSLNAISFYGCPRMRSRTTRDFAGYSSDVNCTDCPRIPN